MPTGTYNQFLCCFVLPENYISKSLKHGTARHGVAMTVGAYQQLHVV